MKKSYHSMTVPTVAAVATRFIDTFVLPACMFPLYLPRRAALGFLDQLGFRLLVGNVLLGQLPDVARGVVLLLFGQMTGEPAGPGDHRDAAHDLGRQFDLGEQRGDRAGGIDGEMAAGRAVELGAELLQERDRIALAARFARDREQPRRPRVIGLV